MSERMKHLSEREPKSKRARYDDHMNSSSTFEEELALFETIESDPTTANSVKAKGAKIVFKIT